MCGRWRTSWWRRRGPTPSRSRPRRAWTRASQRPRRTPRPRSPSSSSGGPTAGPHWSRCPDCAKVVDPSGDDRLAEVSAELTTVQRVDITRIAAPGPREDRYQGTRRTFKPHVPPVLCEGDRRGTQGPFRSSTPSINAEPKEVTNHGHVHLAIAVDGPSRSPRTGDQERLNLAGLAGSNRRHATRARTSKIGPRPSSAEACSRSPMWRTVGFAVSYPDHQPAAGGDTRQWVPSVKAVSGTQIAILCSGWPAQNKVGSDRRVAG